MRRHLSLFFPPYVLWEREKYRDSLVIFISRLCRGTAWWRFVDSHPCAHKRKTAENWFQREREQVQISPTMRGSCVCLFLSWPPIRTCCVLCRPGALSSIRPSNGIISSGPLSLRAARSSQKGNLSSGRINLSLRLKQARLFLSQWRRRRFLSGCKHTSDIDLCPSKPGTSATRCLQWTKLSRLPTCELVKDK